MSPTEFAVLCRNDFYAFNELAFRELNPAAVFLHNWHIELIASRLEQCRHGKCRRLIINVPPRGLKSLTASVAFPAWMLGHHPEMQIIAASYGQDLAEKLSRDCRAFMDSASYQSIFPTRLSPTRRNAWDFMTTAGGGRLATSVGGVLTGRGADLIILDDILKPTEALSDTERQNANDWYSNSLLSRLNNKASGCIIIVMQRLHLDDLVGHVMEQEGWEILALPAIAIEDETHLIETPYGSYTHVRSAGEALHPERESLEILSKMRAEIGEYNFASQYQQNPVPLGGGLVKTARFAVYEQGQLPARFDLTLQSWDTATKETELADFSVCTTWGLKDKKIYLLHVLRKKMEYPELKNSVKEQYERFSPDVVLIEDKSSGTQLIQELKQEGCYAVQGVKPEGDKLMRLVAQTPTIENGFVYLPMEAPWLHDYLNELMTFPKGKYNDQVDSTSQALAWIKVGINSNCLGFYYYMKSRAEQAKGDG
jgi:predicted phage terminase large subunit-like protein